MVRLWEMLRINLNRELALQPPLLEVDRDVIGRSKVTVNNLNLDHENNLAKCLFQGCLSMRLEKVCPPSKIICTNTNVKTERFILSEVCQSLMI